MSRWAVPLVGFAALSANARAEPPPIFELSVVRGEGAGSCPSANDFARRVSTRLGRNPFTDVAEHSIEVGLTRQEDAWRGRLVLREGTGIIRGEREIAAPGTDCTPLAEAVTLAIALTIDPDAALGAPGGAATVPALPPPPPPPPACPIQRCPSPAPCPTCPQEKKPSSAVLAASLRGTLAGGLIPGAAPGVELAVEAGGERVRAAVGLLYLPETRAEDPRFAFGLMAAMAGACGAFRLGKLLELGLCGELQIGAIHAVVHELEPLEPGDELWLALAAGPRLRLEGLPPAFLELGVTGVIPLLDREFVVDGFDAPVFETAPFGGIGFVGVGLRSP